MKVFDTYGDGENVPESVGELFTSNNELYNLLNNYGIFRDDLENLPTINTAGGPLTAPSPPPTTQTTTLSDVLSTP